ncbi:MAG: VanZ family protein, partial [Candidatus Limnocylindrales bacterium]
MSRVIARLVDAALRVPAPLRWLAVVAWAAMIFLASNQPGLAVSEDPGVDRPLRQVAHIGVYAVLASLLTWGLTGRRHPTPKLALLGGALALIYGISDEWHQTMVPTRTGRPEDLVWDGVGAMIAVAVIAFL